MWVKFTDLAVADLQEIGEWLLRTTPQRAFQTIFELRESCERLKIYPKMGSRLTNGVRKLVIGEFLALYRIKAQNEIQVLHISPAVKDWKSALRKRL